MDTLGRRLKAARKKAGLKQNVAAAEAGISGSHLSKIESDEDRPSLEVLLRLAVLYGCDVRDLAQDDDELGQAEVTTDPDEINLVRAYRRMTPEQRAGVTALLGIRKLA